MALQYGKNGADGKLGKHVQDYLSYLMTDRLAQETVFNRFCTKGKDLPQNKGDTIEFKRWVPMRDLIGLNNILRTYTGNALTEDANGNVTAYEANAINIPANEYSNYVLPEGSSGNEVGAMKEVTEKATVFPIGMYMTVTEETQILHDRYTMKENITQYSEVASLIIDGFYRDTFIAGAGHLVDATTDGTNAIFVGTGDVNADATLVKGVRKLSLQLRLSGAKYVNEVLAQSPKYAKQGILGRYIGIVNTLASEALRDANGFRPVEDYPGGVKLLDNEIGMIGDVRVIENPNAPIEAGANAGEYKITMLVMGKEHTSDITLRGKGKVEVIVKGLGQNGNDPLNRVSTIGWKAWLGAITLYPERLGKIEFNIKA